MKFKYKIKTQAGELKSDIIEAQTKEDAIKILQSEGFYIINITEVKKIKKGLQMELGIGFLEKISKKELSLFTKQLAIMTKAGVSLVESLDSLSTQTKNRKFKKQILSIKEEISRGNLLSQAFLKFPKTFSSLYINIIAAGEKVGKLNDSLFHLTDHLEREIKLESEIKSALAYPVFVFVFSIFAGIVAIVNIIPAITKAFVGMELPLETRILIGLSDFFINYGVISLLSLIFLFCLFSIFFKTDKGIKIKANILLRIPVLGSFLKQVYITRFSQSLAVLISSGVPIINALEISAKSTDNIIYEEIIIKASHNINKGDLLSSYLKKYPKLFPVVFTQILSIGEKAGQMNKSLADINEYYQREVEIASKQFTELLTPIIMIFLGIGVGFLMFAVWRPMFEMMDPGVM